MVETLGSFDELLHSPTNSPWPSRPFISVLSVLQCQLSCAGGALCCSCCSTLRRPLPREHRSPIFGLGISRPGAGRELVTTHTVSPQRLISLVYISGINFALPSSTRPFKSSYTSNKLTELPGGENSGRGCGDCGRVCSGSQPWVTSCRTAGMRRHASM